MTSSSLPIPSFAGICILLLYVVSCFSMDLDELSTYADELADETNESDNEYSLNKADASDMSELPVPGGVPEVDKRTFSITGDLQALADMLYYDDRGKSSARPGSRHLSALLELGKRGWSNPIRFLNRLSRAEGENEKNSNVDRVGQVLQKRSQHLSVSGPLSALANMLATEGRRRLYSESNNNRMRLLQMGKRSEDGVPYSRNDVGPIGQFKNSY